MILNRNLKNVLLGSLMLLRNDFVLGANIWICIFKWILNEYSKFNIKCAVEQTLPHSLIPLFFWDTLYVVKQKIWSKDLIKSFEQKLWTMVLNKNFEQKLLTRVMHKICEQKLETEFFEEKFVQKLWAKLWTKIVNKI